eukprot:GHVT01044604.1.p2 GENE.GHVT01044604.1~~GHVT01044604.1.p2  ORF type:complete len:216 (-),score=42.79 GHVT01044604.1:166-813(-)
MDWEASSRRAFAAPLSLPDAEIDDDEIQLRDFPPEIMKAAALYCDRELPPFKNFEIDWRLQEGYNTKLFPREEINPQAQTALYWKSQKIDKGDRQEIFCGFPLAKRRSVRSDEGPETLGGVLHSPAAAKQRTSTGPKTKPELWLPIILTATLVPLAVLGLVEVDTRRSRRKKRTALDKKKASSKKRIQPSDVAQAKKLSLAGSTNVETRFTNPHC